MAQFLLYCVLALFTVITFCATASVDSTKDEKSSEASMESNDDYDLMGAINNCNETFRIEMSYLKALNESGSFPDETDKTPKCYIKCILETLDIASPEGDFDPELLAMKFAGLRTSTPMDGIKEIATLCAERSETCKCERSYNYLKCVYSMEIERYEKKS